jgi:anti-anti-sigma factor
MRGAALVCRIAGELDMAMADQLESTLTGAAAGHPDAPLVLDVREVGFMDSSGVRALLTIREALARERRALVLAELPPAQAKVLRLLSVEALLPSYPSVTRALDALDG